MRCYGRNITVPADYSGRHTQSTPAGYTHEMSRHIDPFHAALTSKQCVGESCCVSGMLENMQEVLC